MSLQLLWLLFSLVWGCIRLFSVRSYSLEEGRALEEDFWGFGQIVPTLLLFIPVLLIFENLSGTFPTLQYTLITNGLCEQKSPVNETMLLQSNHKLN